MEGPMDSKTYEEFSKSVHGKPIDEVIAICAMKCLKLLFEIRDNV